MKINSKAVPARFAPEIGFEVPTLNFRAVQATRFDRLQERLLQEAIATLADPVLNSGLRQAANDAAALAWGTELPLLFFPELFAEKIRAARRQGRRQQEVHRRSTPLMREAA